MSGTRGRMTALDALAVQRDADALNALADRAPAAGDDEVLRLLAALAAEVDAGLSELPPLPGAAGPEDVDDAADAEVLPLPTGRRRGAARTVVAALVATGVLTSVSGVAAAVNGDALSPYKSVLNAVAGRDGDLPPTAAEVARLHKQLAGVRAAIAHGDVAAAQTDIEAVRQRLSGLPADERRGVERALAGVERRLARLTAAEGERARYRARSEAHDRALAPGVPSTGVPGGEAGPPGRDPASDPGATPGSNRANNGVQGTKPGAPGSGKPDAQKPGKDKAVSSPDSSGSATDTGAPATTGGTSGSDGDESSGAEDGDGSSGHGGNGSGDQG